MKMQLLAVAILAGLFAPPPVHAQEKLTAEEEGMLTLEEKRQRAHLRTANKFKALKEARAAKEKADCEGTPE